MPRHSAIARHWDNTEYSEEKINSSNPWFNTLKCGIASAPLEISAENWRAGRPDYLTLTSTCFTVDSYLFWMILKNWSVLNAHHQPVNAYNDSYLSYILLAPNFCRVDAGPGKKKKHWIIYMLEGISGGLQANLLLRALSAVSGCWGPCLVKI